MTPRSVSVSVVIPYYNSHAVFSQCIESVLRQTVLPLEIVVVDDGSSPESLESLKPYEGQIRLLRSTENLGVAAARNRGVLASSGELIAFLDSDDKWAPDKLEKQVEYLAVNPDCHAVHTGVVVFNKGEVVAQYLSKPSPLALVEILHSSHVTPTSFMIRREVFVEAGGFDEKFRSSEDYEFSIRLVSAGRRIDFIPEPLVYLRREMHGNLSSKWKKVYLGHLKVVWRHRELYRRVLGKNAVRVQCAQYTVSAGQRRGGVVGRAICTAGKLIGFSWVK